MVEEAVVLAAGLSKRFRKVTGVYKVFADINGLPLITYPTISLYLSGIKRIIVVVNNLFGREVVRVIKEILHDKLGLNVDIDYVVNKEPELGNGYSLYLALKHVRSPRFIVSMSDHIYTPSIISKLVNSEGSVLGGDSNPKYIDVDEATKIVTRDHRVVCVSKNLSEYNYVDIGVHVLERNLPYSECLVEPYEFSQLLTCLASLTRIGVVDINGMPWTDVDTVEEYNRVLYGSSRIVLEEVLREWKERGLEL